MAKKRKYNNRSNNGRFGASETLFTVTLPGLPDSAASPQTHVIRRFFRRASRYASVYRLGATGPLAEYAVKKFKSHRSVTQHDLTNAEEEKGRKDEKKVIKGLH
jgi:hypothetical protein